MFRKYIGKLAVQLNQRIRTDQTPMTKLAKAADLRTNRCEYKFVCVAETMWTNKQNKWQLKNMQDEDKIDNT
jgi:hypothetical protein